MTTKNKNNNNRTEFKTLSGKPKDLLFGDLEVKFTEELNVVPQFVHS